jgi:hypothetical protein
MDVPFTLRWTALLDQAVTHPGLVLEAYSRFHGYSIGNQIAALSQCLVRGLEPGPIATFPKWKELGRSVKRGEKAIWLCMPITVAKPTESKDSAEEELHSTYFVWKPRWFVLAQTEGDPYEPEPIPTWSIQGALERLQITDVSFEDLDGNIQGYAKGRTVAVSPIAQLRWKTLFHEIGHVLLGHTAEGEMREGQELPRNLREAEAESVALLCSDALGLPGSEYCRGYIQHWYGTGNPIPEASARHIFGVADAILKAGREGKLRESSFARGGAV